jgi:hypothetical protein
VKHRLVFSCLATIVSHTILLLSFSSDFTTASPNNYTPQEPFYQDASYAQPSTENENNKKSPPPIRFTYSESKKGTKFTFHFNKE